MEKAGDGVCDERVQVCVGDSDGLGLGILGGRFRWTGRSLPRASRQGSERGRTDLDDGCGIWRPIGEKILRKIDGGVGEPGWILGRSNCRVDYVTAFGADDSGVVPNVRPKEVDVGYRPLIEVLVRL